MVARLFGQENSFERSVDLLFVPGCGGGGESGTGRVKLLACAKGRGDSS